MTKLKLYVKVNSPLVKQFLRRRGVVQGYHVLPAPGSTPMDPEEKYRNVPHVPRPAPRAMLPGQLGYSAAKKRMGFIVGELASKYSPQRGRPKVTVGDRTTYTILGELYGHDPDELMQTAAFYHIPTHTIYVSGATFRYLESDNSRLWVAATHLIAHEWYHALRYTDDRYIPLEEGGAEIFASRMGEALCGVDHPDLRLRTYAPYREGLLMMNDQLHPPVLNDQRRPDERAFKWVVRSRTQGQEAWMKTQLDQLGVSPTGIANLMRYYKDTEGPVWLDQLRKEMG